MKLVGTITDVVQTGMDFWENRRYSKVFEMTSTFQDVEDWAKLICSNRANAFEQVQMSMIREETLEIGYEEGVKAAVELDSDLAEFNRLKAKLDKW